MTSSDQVEERHQYFSIIFFVYREMRVPNHQRQTSPVSVWPLALIICCEVLLNVASTNFTSGNSFPAYFDLKCEPGTAWTLVMSWSVGYRWPPPFTKFPFKYNSPVNENAQNWNLYRLSLVRMRSLQGHSTHWRATCSYPTTASISETTSAETSRISTSLISLETASARKWNTSTPGDTWVRIWRCLSGRG